MPYGERSPVGEVEMRSPFGEVEMRSPFGRVEMRSPLGRVGMRSPVEEGRCAIAYKICVYNVRR